MADNTSGSMYGERRQAQLEVKARSKKGLTSSEARLLKALRDTYGPADFGEAEAPPEVFGAGGVERAERRWGPRTTTLQVGPAATRDDLPAHRR